MHPRALIRQRVIAALVNATDAGPRVFDSPPRSVWPEEFPALHVYVDRDDVATWKAAPRAYKATVRVTVEVYARDRRIGPNVFTAATQIDNLVDQVEAALDADRLLRDPTTREAAAADGPDSGVELSIETDFDKDDRNTIGIARVTWQYVYVRAAATVAKPPAQDLDTVHVEFETSSAANDVPEAVDDIDQPG